MQGSARCPGIVAGRADLYLLEQDAQPSQACSDISGDSGGYVQAHADNKNS